MPEMGAQGAPVYGRDVGFDAAAAVPVGIPVLDGQVRDVHVERSGSAVDEHVQHLRRRLAVEDRALGVCELALYEELHPPESVIDLATALPTTVSLKPLAACAPSCRKK